MKRMSLFALAAVTALVFAGSLSALGVGEMGPNFKFDKSWNFPGGETELDQFRGRVVLIESWATW